MTLDDALLTRIIHGAHTGSLVLTATEYQTARANAGPNAAVIVNGNPVGIWSLVCHLLPDEIGALAEIPSRPTCPMHRQLLASYHDGLLDLADVARLWNHPAEFDYLEPPL